MSDKYYRGLRNFLNDTKHKLQLASMTLKINENKNSISGIKNDISGINNFSDKINDNSSKINDNNDDINEIRSNLNNIKNDISEINNFSDKINDNENNISNNLEKINDNDNDIDEIRSNLNNIKNDLSDFKINYLIQNLFLFDINIEQNYTLNKENPEFIIFSYNLEDDFKSNIILEFNCKILYNYNSYNSIGHLTHIYKLYDENNTLIYEYKFLKANAGDNSRAYLNQNDLSYVKINKNYTIIKIKLFLSIIDKNKTVTCKLLNTFKSNFLVVKLYKKINTLSVNNNLTDLENNISSNLTKIKTNLININTNENNIATNLEEINYLKNNKSTQYLKNIYNILIYDSKIQISFKEEDIFYEKVFDINAGINNFVEIFFKIQLEYQDTDDRHYVKSIYELFDENNNSLYVKSINNNEYLYFSNKMTINENIFYNFTNNIKKLKFVIKFQKLSSTRIIYLYYIKTDNYRLILKHFGN